MKTIVKSLWTKIGEIEAIKTNRLNLPNLTEY